MGMIREPVDLREGLERIARAPLKPQQKMEVLRTFLLPGLLHHLLFNATGRITLAGAGVMVRGYVRRCRMTL